MRSGYFSWRSGVGLVAWQYRHLMLGGETAWVASQGCRRWPGRIEKGFRHQMERKRRIAFATTACVDDLSFSQIVYLIPSSLFPRLGELYFPHKSPYHGKRLLKASKDYSKYIKNALLTISLSSPPHPPHIHPSLHSHQT